MEREKAIRTLRAHQATLAKSYGVKSLSMFGSVARDEARADSDIDLLVEFERPVGLFAFIGLQQYLEGLLGCRVDLGTPRSLKPIMKDSVLKEAIRVS